MGWPYAKIKECCTVVGGATPKRDVPEYWGNDIPWITPKDISNLDQPVLEDAPEYISQAGFDNAATYLLPKGAVLLTSRAPIGNVAIAGREMCTNQGFKSLIPGEDVDSRYLYHCMKRMAPKLEAIGNGATFKEVSKSLVENFEIPLPPLPEQKRIAAILDKADAIRRKRQQAIQLADEFLRSVFLDMFGDPSSNQKNWKTAPIKRFGNIVTGNTPSRKQPEYYGDYIEWIKSDNINTPAHFLTTASEYLSESGRAVARTVPAGSILVTCIAGSRDCIGNVALADREVAFNQQINAIIPNDEVNKWFLYGQILFAKSLIQAASTNSMKGMVSKSKFEQIELLNPPERLQCKFGDFFQKHFELTDNLRALYGKSQETFSSISQRAFRGDL